MALNHSHYDSAFYVANEQVSSRSARALAPLILSSLRPNSIVDVGCGTGTWLRAFEERGVTDILGIDGEWTRKGALLISSDKFLEMRLDSPPYENVKRRFDLVTSLEVAEHLPPATASAFIEYLTSLADVVLFSAAIPFQGGTSHLNEQWPDYWYRLFEKRGYECLDGLRPVIWSNEQIEWYYRQNLLIYFNRDHKDEFLPRLPPGRIGPPLSLVHPGLYIPRQYTIGARINRLASTLGSIVPGRLKHIVKRALRHGPYSTKT